MFLPAARLRSLDFAVLGLETARLFLSSKNIFNKGALPLLVRQTRSKVFGRAFNDSSHLRELWNPAFAAVVLLIVPLRIQNRAHAKQLEIALQLWCKDGPW